MNYIDITNTQHKLNINLNVTDSQILATIEDDLEWHIFKDGNDTEVVSFDNADSDAYLISRGYYVEMGLPNSVVSVLEDETQYNLTGVNGNKVLYRGKFQTTSKDIANYSINENKYTPKINPNNYTILD